MRKSGMIRPILLQSRFTSLQQEEPGGRVVYEGATRPEAGWRLTFAQKNENAFITRVLHGPKVWAIGTESDLPVAA